MNLFKDFLIKYYGLSGEDFKQLDTIKLHTDNIFKSICNSIPYQVFIPDDVHTNMLPYIRDGVYIIDTMFTNLPNNKELYISITGHNTWDKNEKNNRITYGLFKL